MYSVGNFDEAFRQEHGGMPTCNWHVALGFLFRSHFQVAIRPVCKVHLLSSIWEKDIA